MPPNDPPPSTAQPSYSSLRLNGSPRPLENGTTMSGSGRRISSSGSGRRVNFDERAAAFGSGRRAKESNRMQASASFTQLSESQQTATESAVSMNHLFSEARRQIRRGEKQAQREQDGTAQTPVRDLESGTPRRGSLVGGGAELTWTSDLYAVQTMLMEDKFLSSLLICIPLGVIAYYTNFGGDSVTFILNFLAIIPLAWLLGNATEELAMRSNETIGGLLNATFGNMCELIVSVVALEKGMIKLVQTSLLGSILSNCLLVLGMSFFLGGLKNKVQSYNQKGSHMLSSLLLLASISLVLPAAFVNSFTPHPTMSDLLSISRITALIMFVIYLLYLFFQLYTHSEMFADEASNNSSETSSEHGDEVRALPAKKNNNEGSASYQNGVSSGDDEEEAVQAVGDGMDELADLNPVDEDDDDDDEDEDDEPSMTFQCALAMLVFATVAVAACSEYLVDSIAPVTRQWGVNESFIGIILIPIVGNAAEHWTAVTVAMKNKMDLAIGVAIGSSTQIALFLIPFITLVGWLVDQPMSLNFSSFETICLVVSVLLVCILLRGESNWLQGVMLIAVYMAVAVAFWYHPNTIDDPRTQNHQNDWRPQPPEEISGHRH